MNVFTCNLADCVPNSMLLEEPRHKKSCIRGFVASFDSDKPAQLQRLASVLKVQI